MSEQNIIVKKLLEEQEIDLRLKAFFKHLDSFVGEDYACLVLSSDISITESLKMFSKKFDDVSDIDIIISLLKASVISNDKDSYINNLVKDYINNGDFEELIDLVNKNLSVRKMLTRNFIRSSYSDNYRIYSKKNDDDNTLGNVLSLKYYKMSLK